MPYTVKGKCVYKKEDETKVGCTKGSIKKYLAALHTNTNESITKRLIKRLIRENITKVNKKNVLLLKQRLMVKQ